MLDRRQVSAPYTSYVGLRLVQCCEHFHYHDLVRLLLAVCRILLCNHTRTGFESHVQFANRCTPWKIANGAENLVLQALQYNEMVSAADSQAGLA
jgi:hypothetical protein